VGPLMERAAREGWRIFYIGSPPGVANKGAATLRDRHPGLCIEVSHGYFNASASSRDSTDLLERIRTFEAHIVMVGMGMPRQERWIHQHLQGIVANVVLPCGACMDYVAGQIPTPPRWMGRVGLEWLSRLVAEPRRLWRRYLIEPWALIPAYLRDLRSFRSRIASAERDRSAVRE
jgi:N-acetylglucosaminyldiphosphoundecaprenol N-acetyl-beta-D-mannosaminyltransferase